MSSWNQLDSHDDHPNVIHIAHFHRLMIIRIRQSRHSIVFILEYTLLVVDKSPFADQIGLADFGEFFTPGGTASFLVELCLGFSGRFGLSSAAENVSIVKMRSARAECRRLSMKSDISAQSRENSRI